MLRRLRFNITKSAGHRPIGSTVHLCFRFCRPSSGLGEMQSSMHGLERLDRSFVLLYLPCLALSQMHKCSTMQRQCRRCRATAVAAYSTSRSFENFVRVMPFTFSACETAPRILCVARQMLTPVSSSPLETIPNTGLLLLRDPLNPPWWTRSVFCYHQRSPHFCYWHSEHRLHSIIVAFAAREEGGVPPLLLNISSQRS